jgi:hypothetical protein
VKRNIFIAIGVYTLLCAVLWGISESAGRITAIWGFLTFMIFGAVWYLFNPDRLITKNAKLNRPEYATARAKAILVMRLACILMALFFIWEQALFTIDVIHISTGGQPIVVQGTITRSSSTPLFEFVHQSIILDEGRGNRSDYSVMFSLQSRYRTDAEYELKILPKSQFVIQVEQLKQY